LLGILNLNSFNLLDSSIVADPAKI